MLVYGSTVSFWEWKEWKNDLFYIHQAPNLYFILMIAKYMYMHSPLLLTYSFSTQQNGHHASVLYKAHKISISIKPIYI